MIAGEALRRDYRAAFLRYLPRRDEEPLRIAYELGRRAVVEDLSILELSTVHHEVFGRVVRETRPEDLDAVVQAASEFFLEVLATYHMVHGGPA